MMMFFEPRLFYMATFFILFFGKSESRQMPPTTPQGTPCRRTQQRGVYQEQGEGGVVEKITLDYLHVVITIHQGGRFTIYLSFSFHRVIQNKNICRIGHWSISYISDDLLLNVTWH